MVMHVPAGPSNVPYDPQQFNFAAEGMDSVKMGQDCLDYVIANLGTLQYRLPAAEAHVIELMRNMCEHVASVHGVQYDHTAFVKALYPLTRHNELTALFDKYKSDKASDFHNYGQYYHKRLQRFRSVPGLRYLELGTLNGASLRAFREYFPLAEVLVAIDIDPTTKRHEDPQRGMHVVVGPQDDVEVLTDVVTRFGPFDVIIDDCSHLIGPTVASFRHLFTHGLKDGGLYIVEDTIAFRKDLAYFFGLVSRYHNRWRYDGRYAVSTGRTDAKGQPDEAADAFAARITSPRGDHCVDPWKMSSYMGHSFLAEAVEAVPLEDSSSSGSLDGTGGGLLDLTAPVSEGGAGLPGDHYSDSDDVTVGVMLGEVAFSNSCIFIEKEIKTHWL